jgi:hypothetical protein
MMSNFYGQRDRPNPMPKPHEIKSVYPLIICKALSFPRMRESILTREDCFCHRFIGLDMIGDRSSLLEFGKQVIGDS